MENNIKSWSDIKDSVYGEIGTQRRDELEREFESLKIGLLLRQAREKKAITQEELGALVNKKRSYISRVENDASNITLKTLFDIVEKGLGAKLALPILATGSINGIVDAINRENILYLTKFPKIGEKLARQIVLDLKGKLDIEVSEDVLDDTQDLIDTLNALGYKNAEIKKVIGQIDKSISLEEQVKEALKLLLK